MRLAFHVTGYAGWLGKCLGWVAAGLLTAAASANAGPLEELKSLSQLPEIDLAKLKSGKILTQRGPEEDFARGISAESCYFIPAPIGVVGARFCIGTQRNILNRNPDFIANTTFLRREARSNLTPRPVDPTGSLADRSHFRHRQRRGCPRSASHRGGSGAHPAGCPQKRRHIAQARIARANDVWGEILRRRSDSLRAGGIAAVAAYGSDPPSLPARNFADCSSSTHQRPSISVRF